MVDRLTIHHCCLHLNHILVQAWHILSFHTFNVKIWSQWSSVGSYTQSAGWTPLELDSGAPPLTLVILPFQNDNVFDGFDFSVERYCPRTNEWETVAAMHESRLPHRIFNRFFLHLVVITGCDFSSYAWIQKVSSLVHSTSSVSNHSFTFGRFGCAVVAHQGRIYVSGGFGQDKVNI